MADNATSVPPTGAAAAAVLAASVGCAVLGICALTADAFPAIGRALNLWPPTGPLSGVTDTAIAVWLVVWLVLSRRWAKREIPLRPVSWVAVLLFIVALLLTFPPFMDLLQRR